MKNALSIDLEDWYYPELVRNHVTYPRPRIEEATLPIINVLKSHDVQATFFILGQVAEKHPQLVRRIYEAGHEIACHGMSHIPLWDLSPEDFDQELKTFKQLMDQIIGVDLPIAGYRAPTFSLDHSTSYALAHLVNHGYQYDSSIFPAKNYMYGIKSGPIHIYRPDLKDICIDNPNGPLTEFPLTVFEIGKFRIPLSGGVYLRYIPYNLLKPLLKKINRTRPFIIYLHPWETSSHTPKVNGLSLKEKLITYHGIENCLKKLENLLNDFNFGTIQDILATEPTNTYHGLQDSRVKHYFEVCAERFDSFYKPPKRSIIDHLGHVIFRQPGMVKRFQTTCALLAQCRGKTILDAGCGSGIYSIYLAKQGARVTGIDFSEAMIHLAQRNARQENCQIDFRHQGLLTLETDQPYDHVLLIGVFDYVPPDELLDYFKKIRALTRETIIATFPKRYTPQAPIRYLWLKRQGCPVYYYTEKQIRKIATDFDLQPIFHDCKSIWTVEFRQLLNNCG